MTCAEIDELAGAIALDAVPDDEGPAIREHLATCARGHPDVRELREVATLLLESVPAMEPPAALRDRILAAARAQTNEPSAAGGSSTPPVLTPRLDGGARPTMIPSSAAAWKAWPAWAAAAAAVLLAAAVGVWNLSLRHDLDQAEGRLAAAEQQLGTEERALAVLAGSGHEFAFEAAEPGTGGTVLRPGAGPATLVVHGLPPRPDKTYQVWAIRGNQLVSLGVFTPDAAGRKVVTLDHDLRNIDAVSITLEPLPVGSVLPTGAPLMVAPVQG